MSVNQDFGGASAPSSQTVTKSQQTALEQGRAKPELQMHYRPDGNVTAKVHSFVEQMRERQIKHAKERLGAAHTKLQQDRTLSVHQGFAKAKFNQKTRSRQM